MTDPSRHRCALTRASSVQKDAAAKGFDWTRPLDALEKIREETDEVANLLASPDSAHRDSPRPDSPRSGPDSGARTDPGPGQRPGPGQHLGPDPGRHRGPAAGQHRGPGPGARLREELGDLLFAAVNVARLAKIDPAPALAHATRKFERRFREVERIARSRGLPMPGTPLEPLDRIWDEVKADEAASAARRTGM